MSTELALIALVLGSLAVTALCRRHGLPAPLVLVVVGLLISLAPGAVEVTFDPNVVLLLVLTPLLYSAGLGSSYVGIRANLRPIERAAFYKSFSEKKYNGLIMGGSAAFGNAATRLEAFAVKGGAYAYGNYPDIDALFQQQAGELDHAKREALLFQIQQLVQEKVIAAPLWQLAALSGVGPRIGEAMIGAIAGDPWTSPYEDMTLKGV